MLAGASRLPVTWAHPSRILAAGPERIPQSQRAHHGARYALDLRILKLQTVVMAGCARWRRDRFLRGQEWTPGSWRATAWMLAGRKGCCCYGRRHDDPVHGAAAVDRRQARPRRSEDRVGR